MPPAAGPAVETREVTGVIQSVDLARRELALLVDGTAQVFDVPPDCDVVLNGERVKLRLLQPLDPARVVYAEARGTRGARLVSVCCPLPCGAEPARRSRS